MEIREVVRLKTGAGGLDPSMNYGILMNWERSKKGSAAVVFTLSGRKILRKRSIQEGTGKIYSGDKGDDAGMKGFLRNVIAQERARNLLKKDGQQIMNEVSVENLWRSVIVGDNPGKKMADVSGSSIPHFCENATYTPEQIGMAHYPGYTLDPDQINGIAKVLSISHPRYEPYFHRIEMKGGSVYAPYSRSAVDSIEERIQRFGELKSHYIEWVEEEADDIPGKKVPRRKMENIKEVELTDDCTEDLDLITSWYIFYMENGKWPVIGGVIKRIKPGEAPPFGLGETPVTRYGKFDLGEFLDHLAMDLAGSRKRDLPSNIILVLLKLDIISWKMASDLIIDYHIASGASKFRSKFPDHVMRSSDTMPTEVRPSDEVDRIDLTDLETITIDPIDAKDFDDAVSFERKSEGIVLWVHIADVSHYIKPHDLIDTEARFRGTSVYLPTGVIPMLPGSLSEGLCSLKEGVKRLAVSTRIRFDSELNIIDWEHMNSVIMVDRNLTYDQVNVWIDKRVMPYYDLWDLSNCLESRYDRLNIDTSERRIRFIDENDIDIKVKRPTKATRLIEQLMVITNEYAAKTLLERGLPAAYRVHPLPDLSSVEKFNGACEALGLPIMIDIPRDEGKADDETIGSEHSMLSALQLGAKISLGTSLDTRIEGPGADDERQRVLEPMDPERMAAVLSSFNKALDLINEMDDQSIADIIKIRMLRTMPRAFYSLDNLGHFGLGSTCYCHFTSPIRRYPDVIVHRAIKNAISGIDADQTIIPELDILIDGINEMTQMAEDWERQMVDVALSIRAEMDTVFRKNVHPGRITSITSSSCYIRMDDGVSEGRIPISRLGHHSLSVDESESRIILAIDDNPDYLIEHAGELTADQISEGEVVLYRIGDPIRCGIFNIQPAMGRIELYKG